MGSRHWPGYRETLIDFATWLSEQKELDVMTPDEAVDMFYEDDSED